MRNWNFSLIWWYNLWCKEHLLAVDNDQKDDIFKNITAIRILLKCTEYNGQLW